jgi:hypothetical protein
VSRVSGTHTCPLTSRGPGGVVKTADGEDEVKADAVPGDNEPQAQQSGPARSEHPTATRQAS